MSNAARKKLNILNNSESLRGESRFLKKQASDMREQSPRALRSLAQIINNDLCHRCGTCVGICPTGVLSCDDEEYPTVINYSACTDCDLCVKVCPGDELDYPDGLKSLAVGAKGHNPEGLHDTHGPFLKGVLAHAADKDMRAASTSGGLVTAVLLGMLRSGEIDGAVTIVSDENTLWKGKPVIARTEEQLLAAMKSKYAITPTNSVFNEIIKTPGRYALVGLPCQTHGFYKAARLNKKLRERVVLTVALFCHAAIEHEAFRVIWETLPEHVQANSKRFVSRIGKHPGSPYVELTDGSYYPVYFGHKEGYKPTSIEMINMLYRMYTPKRCMTCFDALGEFADISVGDPWMAPPEDDIRFDHGWSFGLLRSQRAVELVERLEREGAIVVRETTARESLSCNRKMSEEKRNRAWNMLNLRKSRSLAVPEYNIEIPRLGTVARLKAGANLGTHLLCFSRELNTKVLKFLLSDGGYYLLWLNRKRRDLKFWTRDAFAALKRRFLGRK